MSYTFEQRFELLCRQRARNGSLRFTLHAPDAFELAWNVYDHASRQTVGRGPTGATAVDQAINNANQLDVPADLLTLGSTPAMSGGDRRQPIRITLCPSIPD